MENSKGDDHQENMRVPCIKVHISRGTVGVDKVEFGHHQHCISNHYQRGKTGLDDKGNPGEQKRHANHQGHAVGQDLQRN